MRRLDPRDPRSRRIMVDAGGAMLGPDCVLVRRTAQGFLCADRNEAAVIQGFLRLEPDDPDWLFRQCCRIARALADGQMAMAQIYGLLIPTDGLDDRQIKQLALAAPSIKANFDPNEPRDTHGRWTGDSSVADARPRPIRTEPSPRPDQGPPGFEQAQLAADNQRQNKMLRDIVVQLQLTKEQQQELHPDKAILTERFWILLGRCLANDQPS
jgi:hypothetical protein